MPVLTVPLGGSRTGGVPEEGALKMGMVCRSGGCGSEGVRGRERERVPVQSWEGMPGQPGSGGWVGVPVISSPLSS